MFGNPELNPNWAKRSSSWVWVGAVLMIQAQNRETDRLRATRSVTLIQPQHKGGAFKGPAKGQCLNCMDEQEYNLTVPVN